MNSKVAAGEEALKIALESAKAQETPRWIISGELVSEQECDDDGTSINPNWTLLISRFIPVSKKPRFIGNIKWPEKSEPKHTFGIHKDILTQLPFEEVELVSLDIDDSWKIVAACHFGGWNDCPFPWTHCAYWRRWQRNFDAHIIGISLDVIEAVVYSPPTNKKAALSLAREQYAYCSDIVDQGVGTVERLADSLMHSESWHFWWD